MQVGVCVGQDRICRKVCVFRSGQDMQEGVCVDQDRICR